MKDIDLCKPDYILMQLKWYEEGTGYFRLVAIYYDEKVGKFKLESDAMGKEFVKSIICKIIDESDLVD
jgi:hypothetical protein